MKTHSPDPVLQRIKPERPSFKPGNVSLPEFGITRWQQGLLAMLGDLNPDDFKVLWLLCSNVSQAGTSLVTQREFQLRMPRLYARYTRAKKYGHRHVLLDGWVEIFPVKVNPDKGSRKRYFMNMFRLNPCILRGEKPEGWTFKRFSTSKRKDRNTPWALPKHHFRNKYYYYRGKEKAWLTNTKPENRDPNKVLGLRIKDVLRPPK